MKRFLMLVALLSAAVFLPGYKLGAEAPFVSQFSRGDVDAVNGKLVTIPGVTGSIRGTFSVIVANDDADDNLLVLTDAVTSNVAGIPTPGSDIAVMSKVMVLFPGEKISLAQGVQQIGLRAETNTVAARVFTTSK